MKIDIIEPNSYAREFLISLDWDEIAGDFEKAVKKFGKKIKLPGFRPGKVPRKTLMMQFQPAIEAEFIEDSVNTYYFKALNEKKLVPVNKAEVSDVHFHFEEHFNFKVTFEIEPEIPLPKLKKNSLKVEFTQYVTDEEDINLAIEDMRKSHVEVQTVEDGAKKDDFLVCDLQEMDASGVPIIGKKLETRYIRIGDGVFGGDNQSKLVGLKPGDNARVTVPVDEKGNLGDYEVSVTNVERQLLPEVNDDFVKLVDAEAKNVSEFKSRIQKKLEEAYANRAEEALDRQLSDACISLSKMEYPPSMVESYLEHMVEEIQKGQKQHLEEEKVREIYKPIAERNLKWYLLRKSILKSQDFEVTKEDLDAEIEGLKVKSPERAKEIEKYYKKPSNRSHLEDDIMEKKILAYLKEFAKIKNVKVHTKDLRKQAEAEAKQQ